MNTFLIVNGITVHSTALMGNHILMASWSLL